MPAGSLSDLRRALSRLRPAVLAAAAAILLAACEGEVETTSQGPRPVRAVTVDKGDAGVPVVLTGRIAAEAEVALAFRISGRITESKLRLGDRVQPGQVVARLEPHNELNALSVAQAGLAAANAQLVRSRNDFNRQERLLKQGHTTRVRFDQAKQELQAAQSQVETAEAQLKFAKDSLGYTELKADGPGC